MGMWTRMNKTELEHRKIALGHATTLIQTNLAVGNTRKNPAETEKQVLSLAEKMLGFLRGVDSEGEPDRNTDTVG